MQRFLWLFHNLWEIFDDHLCMKWRPTEESAYLSSSIRSIFQRAFRHDMPYHSSKYWYFPNNIFLSFILSQRRSTYGGHHKFLSRAIAGCSILFQLFDLRRGRITMSISGSFSFDNCVNLGTSLIVTLKTEIASLVSLIIPWNFEMKSKNVVVVICDAEVSCSVNTALYPWSSLTLPCWSITRHLYFWRIS